ncbi:MAG TPA: aromatic amino acid ammonia-lyase [Candidatus Binatia bacterium]|nr:aromatic amino acid ammonia-lyase [Candidatus Binatia bacterium]
MKTLVLDGKTLTIKDLVGFCRENNAKVSVNNSARRKIVQSHSFLMQNIKKFPIYGINTGFGPMADRLLGQDQLWELQLNLIRSHSTGMGNPVSAEYILAAMVIRLNTLSQGLSGVSVDLIDRLIFFINNRIIPCVPEHGAVGTSGDLVQLAHIALGLIGEGKVWHKGKIVSTASVIKKLKIPPYQLKPKEGLALINGTSFMTAIASFVCDQADRLLSLSVRNGSMSLELVRGFTDSLSEVLHAARPQEGQNKVASVMRQILSSSKLLRDRCTDDLNRALGEDVIDLGKAIQEVYSLRCIAQILGPIQETLTRTKRIVSIEMNSVTDNPIVDVKNKVFLHGGNFHGDYVASAIDQLKAALVKLTLLSERRINFFLNKNVNKFLPPFINLNKPGLTLGLQGLQFVATSTTANSQTLAFPMHIHSISTNADNQDVVSMGTDAALMTSQVSANAFIVLAIEAVVLSQAVDFTKIENRMSKITRELYLKVRKNMKRVDTDRVLADDMDKVMNALKNFEALSIADE